MPSAKLNDRAILKVEGADARSFLQGLVTCDMAKVNPQTPAFGAILTPQGKIICDFIISESADAFLLDCPAALVGELVRRLGLYRLRAKVTIADASADFSVLAFWGGDEPQGLAASGQIDPRNQALGVRLVCPTDTCPPVGGDDYEAMRIAVGVPSGGLDFAYGDTFPHEANMDRLHGVDFKKGCYIGQEVVSRVEHRGTARKRIARVSFAGSTASAGADILDGELTIGTMGSSNGSNGLAMVRLDKVADAMAAGRPLHVNGQDITVHLP